MKVQQNDAEKVNRKGYDYQLYDQESTVTNPFS